jgi:aryl-alcohol dehydrogenase-like predicted oxidoreductase
MIDIKEEERRVQRIYKVVGKTYGNRAQLAVRYGLSTENLHCTVLGLATLEHLQNAIQAVEMGPLPEDVLEKILELQNSNFL